jgi:hypothetical protein
MNLKGLFVAATALLLLAACDEKKAPEPVAAPATNSAAPAPAAKPTEPAAAPAPAAGALAWKNLDKLGAKVEVPADATVEDTSSDGPPKPPPSYSVYNNSGDFNLMISGTSDLDPETIDAMKKQLAMDPNKVKKYTKEEKGKDSWVLEWEADSMMEPGKTLYGVNVKRTVAGKGISCARNVDKKDAADAISKACRSITAK